MGYESSRGLLIANASNALFSMPYIKHWLSAKLAAGQPCQINLMKKLSELRSITNVQILLTEQDQFKHLFYFIDYIKGIILHTILCIHAVFFLYFFVKLHNIQISGGPKCFQWFD